jgi:mRNA-degrading endonuclease RelE of RelBE toxin-antitoxin system
LAKKKAKSSSEAASPLEVDFGQQAIDYIGSLDKTERKLIGYAIRAYQNLQRGDVKALRGHRPWQRLRVGNHRVVFRVEAGVMMIPLAGDRKEIYKLLRKLAH